MIEIKSRKFAPLSGSHSTYLLAEPNLVSEVDEASVLAMGGLSVDFPSIAHLLDSGAIPWTSSVYRNFHILNGMHSGEVGQNNKRLTVTNNFPYLRKYSKQNSYNQIEFMNRLYAAVERSIDNSRQSVLFLSSGKDSAALAVAMAECCDLASVHAITYSAPNNDESEAASRIAKRFGFSHEIINVDNYYLEEKLLKVFFTKQFIPSLDLCSTAYLHCGLEAYEGCNLVDGMGNDQYIGHIPPKNEATVAQLQGLVPYPIKRAVGALRSYHRALAIGSKTRSEMVGFWSFLSHSPLIDELLSFSDRRKVWYEIDRGYRNYDYLDLRAELRGSYIDFEKFIRKVKNAASTYKMALSLPWCDFELASYCHNLKDDDLFSRSKLINKCFLREFLGKKTGIDYFNEPKFTFSYDFSRFVLDNYDFVKYVCLNSNLFKRESVEREFKRFEKFDAYGSIYQLFLISGWFKYSQFVNRL